jgi:putative adhesin
VELKGKLDVQGRGSDMELENIAGQVTITGDYTGSLDFKNLAKPLQFEGTRNTELSVQAVPGHINMDLGQFNGTNLVGPVRFMSGSRDVRLQQFTQSLEMDARRGDISLQPVAPMPTIEVRSGTGRVELIVPEKAAFQLEATAEHGDAINDYGPPIQKESDGRTSVLKGSVGSGPTVHLTANRGSVEIRKEGTTPSDIGAPAPPDAPPAPPKVPRAKDLKDSEFKM